ncbi:hypothetical protein MINTM018_52670 (plasmid) [Mycobacterium intracellulare]|uniref:Uncharacterized protein n=2 Tax=Mycobacterium intracellulare TaxID=1767 RepID=A0A7R7RQ39_MYCIT|nr:hypothetical protein MINTM018_52670 [Mycobacterium intracellulare]
MTFNSWKQDVNLIIRLVTGFDADDLTDYPYREAWDNGRKPASVAYEVLAANGYLN